MWKNALSHNVQESFKEFLDPVSGADDCQNVISFSLSTDESVAKFSQRSGRSFYAKLPTDKSKDRQMPDCQIKQPT